MGPRLAPLAPPDQARGHRVKFVFRLALAVAAVFALSGCDQGPSQQAVTADLSQRLEDGYTAGLFDVESVAIAEPPPAARLDLMHKMVPFTISLKLKRDHDFGAWDQANANTLLQILGGRPEAISGVKTGGNKTGDVIRITGVAEYQRDQGRWQIEPPGRPPRPPRPRPPPAPRFCASSCASP